MGTDIPIRGASNQVLGYIDPGLYMHGTFGGYIRLRDIIRVPSTENIGYAVPDPEDNYPTEAATRVFSRPSIVTDYWDHHVGRISRDGVVTDNNGDRVGRVSPDGFVKNRNDVTIARIESGDPVTRVHAGGGLLLLILPHQPFPWSR